MGKNRALHHMVTRRQLLGAAGIGALAVSRPSWAQPTIDLALPGGPDARQITTAFSCSEPVHRCWKRHLKFLTRVYSHPTINSTYGGIGP